MSFSGDIKEELSKQNNPSRHCQIAELAALISICGEIIVFKDEKCRVKIHTENLAVVRKCFTLIEKTFNIKAEISIRRNLIKRSVVYELFLPNSEDAHRILQATKVLRSESAEDRGALIVPNLVIQKTCCRRAFIRGAFLATGSISDPKKSYHFEIVCVTMSRARQLQYIMNKFLLDAKIIQRKKTFVVYLKEGGQVVDILNIMEAHQALMELENVRILKEMRNTVNRKVNCETANISKTVSAAVKQLEDITYIKDTIGFDQLSDGLGDMALTRLENPEATLKELGELLTPAVGKSGVNHRLRRLSEIAGRLRENKEAFYD